MTRVYVGATLEDVTRWRTEGAVPAGTDARAVTEGVVRELADSDDEEREYAVTALAADDSLEALRQGSDRADHGAHGDRRVVLVAERAVTEPGADPGSVRLSADLGWRDVTAILVDEEAARERIRAAVADPAEELDDLDLAWYLPAELDTLTRGDG